MVGHIGSAALLAVAFSFATAEAQTPSPQTPQMMQRPTQARPPQARPPQQPQQPQREMGEVRGLKLGMKASDISMIDFTEHACGSNGGPPRQPIAGWTDFMKCPAEETGLREVYARFDDQREYMAKALDDPLIAKRVSGTRVGGHPVILSVLFDQEGTVGGIRMVTDNRAPVQERRVGHMFRFRVMVQYGREGWECVDLEPVEGEGPVGGVFVKVHCAKQTPERYLTLDSRLVRKPGQADYDPTTREYNPGMFDSSTRFEILDPKYKKS